MPIIPNGFTVKDHGGTCGDVDVSLDDDGDLKIEVAGGTHAIYIAKDEAVAFAKSVLDMMRAS